MSTDNVLELQQKAEQYFEGYCHGSKIGKDDIIIRRDFLIMVGGNLTEAAIFSRIMHYQPYLREKGRDELAKNHNEWQDECGVSSSAARKALKRLEEKKLITTRVGKFDGKNAVFIKVDKVTFFARMTKKHLLQKDTSPVTKGQVDLLQKDRSIYKDNIQGIQQGKESPQTPTPAPVEAVAEKTPAGSQATPERDPQAKKKRKLSPQQYRSQLEEKEQQRWDVLFKAIEIGIHEINTDQMPPDERKKAKQIYAQQIHAKVHFCMDYEWMDAAAIEDFIKWYEKDTSPTTPKPTRLETFKQRIIKFVAQHNVVELRKPDKHCPRCRGAGKIVTKAGDKLTDPEYGPCPVCMAEVPDVKSA